MDAIAITGMMLILNFVIYKCYRVLFQGNPITLSIDGDPVFKTITFKQRNVYRLKKIQNILLLLGICLLSLASGFASLKSSLPEYMILYAVSIFFLLEPLMEIAIYRREMKKYVFPEMTAPMMRRYGEWHQKKSKPLMAINSPERKSIRFWLIVLGVLLQTLLIILCE